MLSVQHTSQCGTRSGYITHLRLKEPTCILCKKANNEYRKKWQAKNSSRVKELSKQSMKRNKKKISIYQKLWYKNNKNEVLKKTKEYYENNKEQSFAKARRRRAKLKNLQTEQYTLKEIIDLYGTVCHICNEEIDMQAPRSPGKLGWEKSLHLDHVIPISRGGTDTMDNVKPSHGICNISKGTKVLVDVIC